jgi:tetratricopeptide (TPR) repeat protein
MGSHHHSISTRVPEAQRFFDQGMAFVFGLNQEAAIDSFQRAAELDPLAGMPHWGVALALGDNINEPIDSAREVIALKAVQRAQLLAKDGNEREKAYIDALSVRYSVDPSIDRKALARRYSEAMRDLSRRYPHDLDAATLYAESLMDLHPWRLWTPDGRAGEDTEEIVRVLEEVLRVDPRHIGANHYYIHAVEASPNPMRALPSARRLEQLAPASGHLLHMPSHIYMHIGDYSAAARSNEAAVSADQFYLSQTGQWGDRYDDMYYVHNLHALVVAYGMEGRLSDAQRVADELVAHTATLLPHAPEAQLFVSANLFVLLRFGRWEQILSLRIPKPDSWTISTFWHFARAIAAARTGRLELAESERQDFRRSSQQVSENVEFRGDLNSLSTIVDLAASVLDATICWATGDRVLAVKRWVEAVQIQDSLNYNEPPDWYYPVRESLGAALLLAAEPDQAERVFRADLQRNPQNPRSLYGLWKSLVAQEKFKESRQVEAEFKSSWGNADVSLSLRDL